MSARRFTKLGLKISISVFFFVYLFSVVGWAEVWNEINQANLIYLVLYVLLGFVGILVSSIKWLVLARSHGMFPRLSSLVLLYMVGYFFNNILPTSIGGDVVRGHALGTMYAKQPEAMASVFVERLIGYTVLIFFALVALTVDSTLRNDMRLVAPIALAVLAYLGICWAVANTRWLEIGFRWFPVNVLQRLLRKIRLFQHAVQMYRQDPATVIIAVVYSIVFYFVSAVVLYVGCLSFGTTVPFSDLLTVVPVLLILLMIPFSFGGIGFQEWAFYFVLGTIGVPGSIGISLGLLFRVRSLGFGLVGGIIYPFTSRAGPVPTSGSAPSTSDK